MSCGARGVVLQRGLGAAREDDAHRLEGADVAVGDVPGVDLAVDPELTHPAGDELRVLRPEIEDEDPVGVDVRPDGSVSAGACEWLHIPFYGAPGSR